MVSLKTAVRTRRIKSIALRLLALGVALIALGFAAFVWRLPEKQIVLQRDADGIVALTGGPSRIADGLELLAAHRGHRLLITGVNRDTTITDIAREHPQYDNLLACCVDLDYSAINTHGNAVQARLWAARQGFHSLIVVTSAYHMPRALAELRHQLPQAAITPFPVLADRLHGGRWWSSGDSARLVVSEYFKYLFAELRMRFDPSPADGGVRQASDVRHP
jgi:uncharacterized SAM-binding protein YcdF (DUF218 family)